LQARMKKVSVDDRLCVNESITIRLQQTIPNRNQVDILSDIQHTIPYGRSIPDLRI